MNAIIFPYTGDFEWCGQFFPRRSLCSLPLAGKPFAIHLLDLCSMLNTSQVRIMDYAPDHQFGRELQSRAPYWPLQVRYGGEALCPGLGRLCRRHAALLDEGDAVIFRGPVMPRVAAARELLEDLTPCSTGDDGCDGIFLWRGRRLLRCNAPFARFDSLQAYFDLNFAILENPMWCNLPGYSGEDGVCIGMDVAIKQDCVIKAPVLLGDRTCLERGCTLRNGAIIGDSSLLDSGTVIDHTLVMDCTFVGSRMEFCNKIVSRERIIDVGNGVYVDQDEVGVASGMRSFHGVAFCTLFEWMMLLILASGALLPYAVALLLGEHFRRSFCWQWLSLDRYTKVLDALFHGGRLIRQNGDDRHYVICASEGFGNRLDPAQQLIDDLYYCHHRSIPMILQLACKSVINRLVSEGV